MRKGLILLTAAMTLFAASPLQAQKKKGNVLDIKESITDNSIVYPESFETDTQALLEGWYMKNYTATDDRYRTAGDNNVSDEVIIERLKNIPSVIEMPFNQVVRKYIDRYTKNGRSLVTACLGLGNYYLPIIEQALEAEGLPLELKYLPMIESAFNPNAVSRAGATGLWQFMLSAAKGYDMEVSSLVDERRDPYESSKKGAKLLKDLYNTYGRWDLAIAAYNCGPGNVNKAIRRAGGDPKQHDFWSIYNYLPSETRGYFPMFVAANYIMNYYQDHNISPVVPTKPLVTDTVGVSSRINLNQIAHVLDIPLDELRLLNPQYRSDVIPGTSQRQYMLILPSRQIAAYIMSEDDIKGYDASKYARRVVASPGTLATEDDLDLTQDTDNLVAEQATGEEQTVEDYRMVREAARKKEEDDRQRAQEARQQAASQSVAAGSNISVNSAGQTVHKVIAGESLEDIAKQHRVSVDQLKIWNNLKRNSVRVGQQLVIKGGSTATVAQSSQSTTSYDDAPAQEAAPARPAAQTSRRSSRAQATQATNAQAAASKSSTTTTNTTAATKKKTITAAETQSSSKKSKKAAETQAATTTSKKGKKGTTETQAATTTSKKSKKGATETQAATTTSKKSKKGATETQASTSKKGKKAAEAAKPTTHEVKGGESLEKIAKKNGVSVEELRKANKQVKGDMIRPGDKVNIPAKKASSTKQSTSKTDSKSSSKKADTTSSKKKADNTTSKKKKTETTSSKKSSSSKSSTSKTSNSSKSSSKKKK